MTMLQVTIEKVPYGMQFAKTEIYTLEIVNDKTGNSDIGNYDVELYANGRLKQTTRVEGHNRADGALKLVGRALMDLERDDTREGESK